MIYDFKKLQEIVKTKVSEKRFIHIMGVVDMSVKLAKIYEADIEKSKIAALLHDVCKEMDKKEMQEICKNNFSQELSKEDIENTEILHSFVGAYWTKKELKIIDDDIINAIKNHTLGRENMSLLEKIIYIADAIELGRNYPNVDKIREMAYKDLDKAIIYEAIEKNKFLINSGKKVHQNTLLMIKNLKNNK